MSDIVLKPLILKAKALLGPTVGLAFLAAAGAWALRGQVAGADTLKAKVAELDTTTVKREEFRVMQRDVRETRVLAESTNAVLRRLVCRQYRDICPL